MTCSSGATGYTRKPNSESSIPVHSVSRFAHQLEIRRPFTRSAGALGSNRGTPSTIACGARCEAAMNSGMLAAGCCPSASIVSTCV